MPKVLAKQYWKAVRKGKKYGKNQLAYASWCRYCAHRYIAARPDSRYCSNACKCSAARKRATERRTAAALVADLKARERSARKTKPKGNPRHD